MTPFATPFYNTTAVAELSDAISPSRLAPYLAEANDAQRAVDLYVWNVRAAAALYGPLSILEVTLRNALNRELRSIFGRSWHDDAGFLAAAASAALRRGDPHVVGPHKSTQIISALSEAKQKAETRFRSGAAATGQPSRTATTDDIVGETGFGFWTRLLNADMEIPFWSRGLYRAFPHWKPKRNAPRSMICARFSEIRRLRNRVMHFEPLLGRALQDDLDGIVEACGWMSPTCAMWIRYHSNLPDVLRDRTRPRHPF